jgi:hypothetical protein
MESVLKSLRSVIVNARGDRRTHMRTVKGVHLEINKTVWYSVPCEIMDLDGGPGNLVHWWLDEALTDPVVSHDRIVKSPIR